MERGMFGILVLSGLCHVVSSLHHGRYNFISEPKSWTEARAYCREKHTDLATVTNLHDMNELAELTKSSLVFLGLYRSWSWSLSEADDYKEGEPAYWNWATGQPTHQLYCGTIDSTGEWFATNCSSQLNFFCYSGSTADISQRFILGEGTMDWLAARDYCRELHTDLARVQNQLENVQLQKMVNNGLVWIGLTGMSWMWSDGTEPSFIPWKSSEPLMNGLDCATLEVHNFPLLLIEVSCDEKLPFFCYSAPLGKHLVSLKLTADSSVDMKDPAVMESILKRVEMRLRDNGVSDGVKLSWRKLPEKENTVQTYKDCIP